jgi:hypothetical protein
MARLVVDDVRSKSIDSAYDAGDHPYLLERCAKPRLIDLMELDGRVETSDVRFRDAAWQDE